MTIELENLRRAYGNFAALDGVSLNVRSGELVALLGPSGSGKTTLLRVIAGLDFAESGEVRIDGVDMSRRHVKERNVGFVFQHYALFKHMTVFENVAFGLKVRPRELRPSPEEIRSRVMALLALVHLDGFHNRYPAQLSGGQRQRVALARSLAVEPKLLLLDEPFGALDAKVRGELRRWLRRLHEDLHVTTLFVTHDQEEAMEVADRVVVMNKGRIEQMGSPEEIYHRPANGFVYDFLGNYNEFAGWRDEKGEVHLAEDDLWEARTAAPPTPAKSPWLSRYPELRRLVSPLMPQKSEAPAKIPRSAYGNFREISQKIAERGVPVRVFARPHEMFVTREPEAGMDYIPATVIHVNPAGALAKIELERKNGMILQADVPKQILDALAVKKGDTLYVRPKNVRVFE